MFPKKQLKMRDMSLDGSEKYFRKDNISFVLSVRPFVLMEQLGPPLDGFSWKLLFEYLSKICWENSSYIKIWQK